jgi:hypothetical protein
MLDGKIKDERITDIILLNVLLRICIQFVIMVRIYSLIKSLIKSNIQDYNVKYLPNLYFVSS